MVTHGPENYKSEFEHEFELEDDEVITKVFVKYHITFILTLKFKTNFGKEFGPFGDYKTYTWIFLGDPSFAIQQVIYILLYPAALYLTYKNTLKLSGFPG